MDATALIPFETAHARDAPFADYDTWLDALEFGICKACGADAWRGLTGWWHSNGNRLCPDRSMRPPGFSPDIAGD